MDKIFLLLSASQGSLLSIALISKILKADYFRFFLGIIFFVISIEIWTYWGLSSNFIQGNPLFPFWSLGSYLLLPPAVNCVLKHLSQKTYTPSKRDFIALLPGIAEILISLIRSYTDEFFQFQLYDTKNFAWVFFTQLFPILWMVFILVIQFKWKESSLKYRFVYSLLGSILLLWIIDFTFPDKIFTIMETMLVAVLFSFGFIAYIKPTFFDPPKISRLDLLYDKYDHQSYVSAYENYLITDKHFTQPNLTLQNVSDELGMSAKYLSYLINKYYQMNFKSHLNQLRTQRFIDQIESNKHQNLTLLAIALDAGFNSKSSFNTVFKKQTGLSPTEYIKKKESENR